MGASLVSALDAWLLTSWFLDVVVPPGLLTDASHHFLHFQHLTRMPTVLRSHVSQRMEGIAYCHHTKVEHQVETFLTGEAFRLFESAISNACASLSVSAQRCDRAPRCGTCIRTRSRPRGRSRLQWAISPGPIVSALRSSPPIAKSFRWNHRRRFAPRFGM